MTVIIKTLALTLILFISGCSNQLKATATKNLDGNMEGMWYGEVQTEEGLRQFFTIRRADGNFFSRQELTQKRTVIEWHQQYGFWGHKDNTYWTQLILYLDKDDYQGTSNCDIKKNEYTIIEFTEDAVVYQSNQSKTIYTTYRMEKDVANYFPANSRQQIDAETKLERFKENCAAEKKSMPTAFRFEPKSNFTSFVTLP